METFQRSLKEYTQVDPLSELLLLLRPRGYLSGNLDAGGTWAFEFANEQRAIMCFAVMSGACWLAPGGVADPVRLVAGDCVVLPGGRSFRLVSDVSNPQATYETGIPYWVSGSVARINGGGELFLAGARFAAEGRNASHLLNMLPPIVHLRKESEQAALRWSLERMREEIQQEQPGGFLMAQQLAQMMLIQALRQHLTETDRGGEGWFVALGDKLIGPVIKAMHADPAYRWTLHDLAKRAGMSRSRFARRFKMVVGQAPMEYLARWRMLLAADRLENTSDHVATIAAAVGYQSESAFSTAFKRLTGSSPRGFMREADHPTDVRAEGWPVLSVSKTGKPGSNGATESRQPPEDRSLRQKLIGA